MKKLIAFLLAATMLISFAACGDTPAESTPNTTTTEAPGVQTTETTVPQTTETTTVETTTEVTTPEETTTAEPITPTVDPTKIFNEDKVVLSFAAISDIHIGNDSTDRDERYFRNALKQLQEYAAKNDADGIDAIIGVGDLTDSYSSDESIKATEIAGLKTAYEAVLDPNETPFVYVLGNHDHDFLRNGGAGSDLATFIEKMGNKEAYTQYDVECPDAANGSRHAVIGDYHFLFVEPVTYSCNGADASGAKYADETLAWLDATLKSITEENPNQFVFVMTHAMIYGTVYGSDLLTSGIYWYTKEIDDVLSKYNQVVTFGGHLHFPLNDPRSIMQTAYTSLGCGSVNYMAIEDGGYENMASATTMKDKFEYSQGILVQLDENGNVRFTRMDFFNEGTIGEDWIVSYPTEDGAHLETYGKDRGSDENNEAPVISDIKAIMGKVNAAGSQLVTIEFAAAEDDEFAHHYELTLTRKSDNKLLKTFKILSDFYRHGDPADMKQTHEVILGNIKPGTECEVKLTAYDSWGAASETLVYTFVVGEEGGEAGTAEKPEAEAASVYADFDFADGKVVDTKGNISIQNTAFAQKATVTHKGTTATVDALVVNGQNQYALCTFSQLDSAQAVESFMMKGFSVEAFYVMNKKGSIQGVVCGTQSGGWGLAEDATGKPYFITGTNGGKYNAGAYASAVSSTTELVHVVAVYDFANNKNNIYINGVLEASTPIQGNFCAGADLAYNKFSLGNDVLKDGTGGDFPTSAMTMVDAKLYTGALTADEAKTAYDNAVSALK